MDEKPVCPRCGQDPSPYGAIAFASAESPTAAEVICGRCAAKLQAEEIKSLDDADKLIAETEEQIELVERILSKFPEMPAAFGGLDSVAMTPMSIYRTLQNCLEACENRRLELFQAMDIGQRLRHELDKAVACQDFERAAKIKRQLEKQS